jgi:hypothetical protein
VDHVTSTGSIDDRESDEWSPRPPDDVLDADVVKRIEELHTAVLWAENDHRSTRGKRGATPTVAEAAEQAYLAEHGFATYNDFRLRIRRVVVTAEPPQGLAAEPPQRFAAEREVVVDESELSPGDALQRRVARLLAAFRVDAERLISFQVMHVDMRVAEILGRASAEADEILLGATQHREAALTSVKKATRRAKRFLAATDMVPVSIKDAREQATMVLRANREDTGDLEVAADVDLSDPVHG